MFYAGTFEEVRLRGQIYVRQLDGGCTSTQGTTLCYCCTTAVLLCSTQPLYRWKTVTAVLHIIFRGIRKHVEATGFSSRFW